MTDLEEERIRRELKPTWQQRLNTPQVRTSAMRVLTASALFMVTVRLLNGRSQRLIERDQVEKTVNVRQQQLQQPSLWIDAVDRRLATSALSPARRAQLLDVVRRVAEQQTEAPMK
jgi:hypothetical protein